MKKREVSLFEFLFLFTILGFAVWFLNNRHSIPEPIFRETITGNHNSSLAPLWVQTNYYMYSNNHTRMAALDNKLFIISATLDDSDSRLIALDSHTGNFLWQYGGGNVQVLTVSTNRVFIGDSTRVTALNPATGEIEWSLNPLMGNVTKLLVRENTLYVDTVGDKYFLFDADTGNLLKAIPYVVDEAPNPDIPIWSDHNMGGQFVGGVRFFQRTGANRVLYEGEITAFDDVNGNQLWRSDTYYVITKMAVSPFGVFTLDPGGNVLKFNLLDGTMSSIIQFAPAPVLYDDESQPYGYYVAVDSDNQMLFVFLGDSAQLFAFHLPVSP